MTATYEKARLVPESGSAIECWLNPTTLSTSRRARFDCKAAIGESVAPVSYMGGDAESLAIALVLHAEDERTGKDVVQALKDINDLLEPTEQMGDKRRPKSVHLEWGNYASFEALCASVDVTVELFDANGTPIRALVNLTLTQFKPDPEQEEPGSQNPTTRALERRVVHRITYGDTLAGLAYQHLRDPTRWREIAMANGIDDPLRLVPGDQLAIPLGPA